MRERVAAVIKDGLLQDANANLFHDINVAGVEDADVPSRVFVDNDDNDDVDDGFNDVDVSA